MTTSINLEPVAQLWWSWTQTTFLQGIAALAIIALLWPWARRWPSGWRYALGMLLLIKFALPWPVEVAVPAYSPAVNPPMVMEVALAPVAPPERQYTAEAPTPREAPPATSMREENRSLAVVAQTAPSNAASAWSWATAGFALWLAGLLAFWGWLGWRAWRIAGIVRRTERAPKLEALLSEAARLRGVTVLWCEASATPMLVGFWRPRILIPAAMREETPERLRLLLVHEEAHLARRDHQMLWLKALLVSLHWWNPLVHWLSTRIDSAMEENCDERVLRRHPGSAVEYGRMIVDAAETQSLRAALYAPAAFAESKRSLMRRIQRIVDFRPEARMSRLSLALAALCVAVLIVPTWTLSEGKPTQAPEDGPEYSPIYNWEQTLRYLVFEDGMIADYQVTADSRFHLAAGESALAAWTERHPVLLKRFDRTVTVTPRRPRSGNEEMSVMAMGGVTLEFQIGNFLKEIHEEMGVSLILEEGPPREFSFSMNSPRLIDLLRTMARATRTRLALEEEEGKLFVYLFQEKDRSVFNARTVERDRQYWERWAEKFPQLKQPLDRTMLMGMPGNILLMFQTDEGRIGREISPIPLDLPLTYVDLDINIAGDALGREASEKLCIFVENARYIDFLRAIRRSTNLRFTFLEEDGRLWILFSRRGAEPWYEPNHLVSIGRRLDSWGEQYPLLLQRKDGPLFAKCFQASFGELVTELSNRFGVDMVHAVDIPEEDDAYPRISFHANNPHLLDILKIIQRLGVVDVEVEELDGKPVVYFFEPGREPSTYFTVLPGQPDLKGIPALQKVIDGPVEVENMPLGSLLQILESESGVEFILDSGIGDIIFNFSSINPSIAAILSLIRVGAGVEYEIDERDDRVVIHVVKREESGPHIGGRIVPINEVPELQEVFEGSFHMENITLVGLFQLIHGESDVQFVLHEGIENRQVNMMLRDPSIAEVSRMPRA